MLCLNCDHGYVKRHCNNSGQVCLVLPLPRKKRCCIVTQEHCQRKKERKREKERSEKEVVLQFNMAMCIVHCAHIIIINNNIVCICWMDAAAHFWTHSDMNSLYIEWFCTSQTMDMDTYIHVYIYRFRVLYVHI